MAQKVLVAVLNAVTYEGYWSAKSIEQRLDLLRNLLTELRARLDDSYGGAAVSSLRAIAALPENFFTRRTKTIGPYGVETTLAALDGLEEYDIQMTRDRATTLMKELKDLSADPANRGVLLFPGTIAFRAPLTASTAHRTGKAITERTTSIRQEIRRFPAGIDADFARGDLATVRERQEQLASNITGFKTGEKSYTAYNSCNVYFNGAVELHYNKHAGYREVVSQATSVIFSPGRGRGEFTSEGFKFGLEICRDHFEGVLKSRADGRKFDVHVVLSASVDEVSGHIPLKTGGYFVHASGNAGLCKVKSMSHSGHLIEVDYGRPAIIDDCSAKFADISLGEAA